MEYRIGSTDAVKTTISSTSSSATSCTHASRSFACTAEKSGGLAACFFSRLPHHELKKRKVPCGTEPDPFSTKAVRYEWGALEARKK